MIQTVGNVAESSARPRSKYLGRQKRTMLVGSTLGLLTLALHPGLSCALSLPQGHGGDTCALGAYRSPSGDLVALDVPPSNASLGVRYTMVGGQQGYMAQADSLLVCDGGVLSYPAKDGAPWARLVFRATPTFFRSKGARLYGVLLEPEATGSSPPLVVLVHGSEKTSPIGLYQQQLLTAQGVATFAYDKRGTGKSSGVYTQDFNLLADDAANAAHAARRLATGRYRRLGFWGGSQGGWVAPLAAVKTAADFVEVGFGVAGNPLEQDQWQVDYQLTELGFASSIMPDVHKVTDVTAQVAASNFTAHFNELNAIRSTFAQTPWLSKIDGQYSGEVLRGEIERAKLESPQVPWRYPALQILKRVHVPQLWVVALDDSVAPSAITIRRLQALQQTGSNIQIFVFPGTDHGIRTYTTGPGGARVPDGLAEGYLRLVADWAKGSMRPPYGSASALNGSSDAVTVPNR